MSDKRGQFTKKQRDILLLPIKPKRVGHLRNQSHLPAYDVEAHLTRVFGFEGWDRIIISSWLIDQDVHHKDYKETGQMQYTVTYGCHLRLTVYDQDGNIAAVKDGIATGSASNQVTMGAAHDMAIKAADSYALKRAAKSFGDQFGLSLYNKGSLGPLVKAVIAYEQDEPDTYEEPQTLGNDEIEDDEKHAEPDSTTNEFDEPASEDRTSDVEDHQELSTATAEVAATDAPQVVEQVAAADNNTQPMPVSAPSTSAKSGEESPETLVFNATTTAEIATIVNTRLSRDQRTAFREWRVSVGIERMPETPDQIAAANVALKQICSAA